MRISDWSSDVCSSDLHIARARRTGRNRALGAAFGFGCVDLELEIDRVDGFPAHRQAKAVALGTAGAPAGVEVQPRGAAGGRRARARSEEHTSELQSLMLISYAVFCLKKIHKQY